MKKLLMFGTILGSFMLNAPAHANSKNCMLVIGDSVETYLAGFQVRTLQDFLNSYKVDYAVTDEDQSKADFGFQLKSIQTPVIGKDPFGNPVSSRALVIEFYQDGKVIHNSYPVKDLDQIKSMLLQGLRKLGCAR